jgi:outer membrane biosynthesis protein TonB
MAGTRKRPAIFFICRLRLSVTPSKPWAAFLQAKKNRPEGRSFKSAEADITWLQQQPTKQRPKQRPKRQQQRQQRPKQPKQQQQRQQQQQEQRLRQQQEQQQERSQLLELLVLGSLQLFSSKQPEQQPSGKRSAGIFSWVFLF